MEEQKRRKALTGELMKAAARRDKALQSLYEAQQDIRKLVVEGFAIGMQGVELAEAAGVKKARIYQIRDGVR